MAFPRRIEFHINGKFAKRHALLQQRYKWRVFKDPNFKEALDPKTFDYSNIITDKAWLRYKTKGIFPQNKVYLRLTITNAENGLDMREYYFEFTKGYQKSLDGRVFQLDPVSGKKIIRDGIVEELRWFKKPLPNGKFKRERKKQPSIISVTAKRLTKHNMAEQYKEKQKVFDQINVHYTEQPRVVFTITPPHLASYAKIVLIMLNQMFNMQVADAYMTNVSQKPDYNTYNMLDEVGNLKSEGSGIPELQTKESIGLGQGQFYTLILQTLQQLNNVQFCASVIGVYPYKSLIRWKNLKSQLYDNVTGNGKRERCESGKKQLDELRAEINSDSCPAIHAYVTCR